MNWIARLLGREQKNRPAGGLAMTPWRSASWLEPSFDRLVAEGYRANAAVFACVAAYQFAFPEPPLVVSRRNSDPLPNHPLQRLLQRPAPIMSEAELALYIVTYLAIGGNCYLWKARNSRGVVVELWPYHAGQISPVRGADRWVDYYEYDPGDGNKQRIETEDIIHLKWPSVDPEQPWMAMPPLRPVARETDTDNELTRYLYALLANDAMPRTAVVLPPGANLKEAQFERYKAQFTQRHGGANRGGVVLLEGGADIKRMSLDMAELAFDALRRVPETRIAAAFRVPPIVAGLNAGLEKSTYANYAQARRAFTETTLATLWRIVADEIEQDLGAEFGGDLVVSYDLSKVQALQENEADKWDRGLKAHERGVLSLNETRRYLGFGDVVGADGERPQIFAYHIEAGVVTVNEVRASLGLPPTPGGDVPTSAQQPGQDARIIDVPKRAALSHQRKAAPEALRQQLEAALRKYLTEQYGAAAAGRAMDDGAEIERLLRQFYPELLELAIAEASAQLGQVYQVDAALIREQVDELATLVRNVADTTRAEVRSLTTLATAEGWSNEQLAREIRQLGEIRSPERARLIARTELASATSRGSLLAYRASGQVERVEWLLGPEPCEECQELVRQTPSVELGQTFYGGASHPPLHPRCTCAIAPIIGGRS